MILNWQDILDAFRVHLAEIPNLNAEIYFPNEKPRPAAVFPAIEVSITETEVLPYTEYETIHRAAVSVVIFVSLNSGTEQAETIAALIRARFVPNAPDRSGFRTESHSIRVREVKQLPGRIEEVAYRTELNLLLELDLPSE